MVDFAHKDDDCVNVYEHYDVTVCEHGTVTIKGHYFGTIVLTDNGPIMTRPDRDNVLTLELLLNMVSLRLCGLNMGVLPERKDIMIEQVEERMNLLNAMVAFAMHTYSK